MRLWGLFLCEKVAHENVSLTSVPGDAQALQNIMAVYTCARYKSTGQVAGEDRLSTARGTEMGLEMKKNKNGIKGGFLSQTLGIGFLWTNVNVSNVDIYSWASHCS